MIYQQIYIPWEAALITPISSDGNLRAKEICSLHEIELVSVILEAVPDALDTVGAGTVSSTLKEVRTGTVPDALDTFGVGTVPDVLGTFGAGTVTDVLGTFGTKTVPNTLDTV